MIHKSTKLYCFDQSSQQFWYQSWKTQAFNKENKKCNLSVQCPEFKSRTS